MRMSRYLITRLVAVSAAILFAGLALALWRAQYDVQREERGALEIVRLFEEVAVKSLPIVVGAGLSVGLVTWFQTHRLLAVHGAEAALPSFLAVALLVPALPVMLAAAPFGSRAAAMASGPDGEACLMPSAFADLAKLPPARVMTPIDLGSHVLLFTPHSVVASSCAWATGV